LPPRRKKAIPIVIGTAALAQLTLNVNKASQTHLHDERRLRWGLLHCNKPSRTIYTNFGPWLAREGLSHPLAV